MLLLKVIASFGELISYFPSHLNVFCFNLYTPSMFIPLDEKTSRSFMLKSFPIAPVILTLLDRYEEDIAKYVAEPPNIFSLVPNSDVIES